MSETPPEAPEGSILNTTKKALGLAEDYDAFDADLVMHINSVLALLNQLGLGPEEGFAITGPSETWPQFLENELRLNLAQSYMYMKVRMLFDPPNVGYVITAMEKQLEQMEWRINTAREEIAYPPVPVVVPLTEEEI